VPSENLEKIWEEFLSEYLRNVQSELPDSYRAKQMKAGGFDAALVIEFETKFLKEPFMEALKKVRGADS